MSWKAWPPYAGPGCARVLPALLTIVMVSVVHSPFEVKAPCVPFRLVTAMASWFTWPKSTSGRTVPVLELGASAITSALEFRQAEPLGQVWAVAMVPPVVRSVSVSCQWRVEVLK